MHDLEGVTLRNQELLSLVRIEHFAGVSRHQRVEERIVVVQICSHLLFGVLFRPKNSSKALGFLHSATEVRRDLNDDIGSGQVYRGVSDFTDEDCIDVVILLEMEEDVTTLYLVCAAIDVRLLECTG